MNKQSTTKTSSQILIHLLLSYSLLLPSSSSSFPPGSLPTKSGYIPINTTSGSSIFYTFYEAQNPISSLSKTPLLIWLQGGPGCSSMTGNFYELGPWRVNRSILLEPNTGAWNRIFGLLFLDNPIGTGFSIASNPDEIPTNQISVARHLFTAIQGFLGLNPGFKTRPVYITGQSYAGKFGPAIGYYILKNNPRLPPDQRVNLHGVAIGNGFTDPVTQITTHAENAYFSGLINAKQKTQIEKAQEKVVKLVEEEKWREATDARSDLRMLQNMTGLATLNDMRRKIPYETNLVQKFLANGDVKKALGVDEARVWEDCSDIVRKKLQEDGMKSVRFMVELLLRESKVLLYQGQSDLRDGVVSTEAWMKKLSWESIGKFMNVERKVWKVKKELVGYVQKYGSLSHVVVLDAGHFVPTDQSVNSQVMIEDWVLERGFFGGDGGIEIHPTLHHLRKESRRRLSK